MPNDFKWIGGFDPRLDCPPDRAYLLDPAEVAVSSDYGCEPSCSCYRAECPELFCSQCGKVLPLGFIIERFPDFKDYCLTVHYRVGAERCLMSSAHANRRRCPLCSNDHDTTEVVYGGVPMSSCPEVPEGYMIPLRKVPVEIFGPQGEVFKSYRYELAGVNRDA